MMPGMMPFMNPMMMGMGMNPMMMNPMMMGMGMGMPGAPAAGNDIKGKKLSKSERVKIKQQIAQEKMWMQKMGWIQAMQVPLANMKQQGIMQKMQLADMARENGDQKMEILEMAKELA